MPSCRSGTRTPSTRQQPKDARLLKPASERCVGSHLRDLQWLEDGRRRLSRSIGLAQRPIWTRDCERFETKIIIMSVERSAGEARTRASPWTVSPYALFTRSIFVIALSSVCRIIIADCRITHQHPHAILAHYINDSLVELHFTTSVFVYLARGIYQGRPSGQMETCCLPFAA